MFDRVIPVEEDVGLLLDNLHSQFEIFGTFGQLCVEEEIRNVPMHLVPGITHCVECEELLKEGSLLETRKDSESHPFVYDMETTETVNLFSKSCGNQKCRATTFCLSYYMVESGEKFAYPKEHQEHPEYFQLNKDTIFSKKLLIRTENDIFYNNATFLGIERAYNDSSNNTTRFQADKHKVIPPPPPADRNTPKVTPKIFCFDKNCQGGCRPEGFVFDSILGLDLETGSKRKGVSREVEEHREQESKRKRLADPTQRRQRFKVNRKRLEEAMIMRRLLVLYRKFYPSKLEELNFALGVDAMCERASHKLHEVVLEEALRHRCSLHKLCGHLLVVDGQQKNYRTCCASTKHVLYTSISQRPVYGCKNTPAVGKKFCKLHLDEETPSQETNLEDIKCEVCSSTKCDNDFLLCDNEDCDRGYHLKCSTQGLTEVPEGDWFCDTCLREKEETGLQLVSKNSLTRRPLTRSVTKAKEVVALLLTKDDLTKDDESKKGKKKGNKKKPEKQEEILTAKKLLGWEIRKSKVWYVVQWDIQGVAPSWEPQENILDKTLVSEFLKEKFPNMINEADYEGEPKCKKNFDSHLRTTCGGLYAMWPCGYKFPPREMISAESLTQVHDYLCTLFAETPFPPFIGYDFMCGLSRFASAYNRQNMSEKTKEFSENVIKVVDSFHFGAVPGKHPGHTDAWCRQHCNPYHYRDLVDHGNMSICEQVFSKWKRYAPMMRHMSATRFNFMLLFLVWLEHEKWDDK